MPQRGQRYGHLKDLLKLLVGPLAESVAVVGSGLVRRHNEEIVAGVDFHGGFDFRQ